MKVSRSRLNGLNKFSIDELLSDEVQEDIMYDFPSQETIRKKDEALKEYLKEPKNKASTKTFSINRELKRGQQDDE